MDLVLVARQRVGSGDDAYFRPRLPASLDRPHGWGQASSEFGVDGKTLCWAQATQAELDDIAAAGGRVIACCPSAESDRMVQAMRAGDLASSREEFIAAYREPARVEEDLARAERGVAHFHAIVGTVGFAIALAWLAAFLGIAAGAALGLLTLHADTVTGADATDLNGRAMSDGIGSWTAGLGTWNILTNSGRRSAGVRGSNLFDSVMGSLGDFRISAQDVQGNNCGIHARRSDNNNFYFFADEGTTFYKLFKRVASAETQLGANGPAPGANKVLSIDCAGTSITGLVDGVVQVGPVTDSALATGTAGFWSTANSRRLDNFLLEIPGGRAKVRASLGDGSQLLGGLVR